MSYVIHANHHETLRPTQIGVNLSRLYHNFQQLTLRSRQINPHTHIMPILKANAYGHGMIRLAQELETWGAHSFGVAFLEEGIALRQAGIRIPILILGGVATNQIPFYFQYNLSITASSIDKLNHIQQAAIIAKTKASVHLKIDTGMERIGVHHYNAKPFIDTALSLDHLNIDGIYSHFANADRAILTHTENQLEHFIEIQKYYYSKTNQKTLFHIANSAAILQLPASHLDLVRPGISLYGIYPSIECKKTIELQPCLSWKTAVSYFKVIPKNTPVSYGSTWSSPQDTRLITLPVGYGDGYFRCLSNQTQVIVHNKKYHQAGTICMDQMMVDLQQGSAYNGDEVILIGESQDHKITVEDLAAKANTIPYEILTNINIRVPRCYIHSPKNESI
jgi:alanine racemase